MGLVEGVWGQQTLATQVGYQCTSFAYVPVRRCQNRLGFLVEALDIRGGVAP